MIKCLIKISDIPFQNRFDYVLGFISQHPLLEGVLEFTHQEDSNFDLIISYGNQESNSFFIPSQKLIFYKKSVSYPNLNANRYDFNSISLYSVELSKNEKIKAFFYQSSFQFDIIETIFFHISRMEEWYCKKTQLDDCDMMKSTEQFLVKNQLYHLPVVDHLIFAFANAIGLNITPQKTKFRITHDIDEVFQDPSLFSSIRRTGGILWRRQKLSAILKVWSAYYHQRNEYNTFDWMLTDQSNIEKCIYFLAGGTTKYDTPYALDTDEMKTIFQLCKKRNYHIGIHPSFDCWRSDKLFKKEKEKLEKQINIPIVISRQHYLHFDFKKTPELLIQNKIKEDSSIGYRDLIGFRCGTGFGYHLYNFNEEAPFEFLEVPLIFMDSSLFKETNHDLEKTTERWNTFLAENQFNTKITFNFHNSRFYDAHIHEIPLKKWYQKLLLPSLSLDKFTKKRP